MRIAENETVSYKNIPTRKWDCSVMLVKSPDPQYTTVNIIQVFINLLLHWKGGTCCGMLEVCANMTTPQVEGLG